MKQAIQCILGEGPLRYPRQGFKTIRPYSTMRFTFRDTRGFDESLIPLDNLEEFVKVFHRVSKKKGEIDAYINEWEIAKRMIHEHEYIYTSSFLRKNICELNFLCPYLTPMNLSCKFPSINKSRLIRYVRDPCFMVGLLHNCNGKIRSSSSS